MNQHDSDPEIRRWRKLYQNPDMVKEQMRNWRSWGSWFSWGSPVGLSIFLLTLTAIVWVIASLF